VVVRTLLVPALVAIMGRWNWWMPRFMRQVLRVAPDEAGARPDAELVSL
jgi:RND superfamily putative drug exporter